MTIKRAGAGMNHTHEDQLMTFAPSWFLKTCIAFLIWGLTSYAMVDGFAGYSTGSLEDFCLEDGQSSWIAYRFDNGWVCEVDVLYSLLIGVLPTLLVLTVLALVASLFSSHKRKTKTPKK